MRHIILFWMQQFYVRPKQERGFLFAGRVLAIAVWPIYLLAFFGVARQRPLVFKVTPKGTSGGRREASAPLRMFRPHLVFALISTACVVVGFTRPDPSPVLMAWAAVNAVLLGSLVIAAAVSSLAARRRREPVPAAAAVTATAPAAVTAGIPAAGVAIFTPLAVPDSWDAVTIESRSVASGR
jgi:hypothetical protein